MRSLRNSALEDLPGIDAYRCRDVESFAYALEQEILLRSFVKKHRIAKTDSGHVSGKVEAEKYGNGDSFLRLDWYEQYFDYMKIWHPLWRRLRVW